MIAGYPFTLDRGFLHQAVQYLHHSGYHKASCEVVSLGGFSAQRARKYLDAKVLRKKPGVVVLQFGSTDAQAPLRNNWLSRRLSRSKPRVAQVVSPLPPTGLDLLKWRLRSLASNLLRVPPITPMETYRTVVLEMVQDCRAAGSRVVVVSPFVMGGERSNRFARGYAEALARSLPQVPEVQFLNAHALLSPQPRKRMLLRDGFHLSPEAHRMLGAALGLLLSELIR
jgi:lysophospholipase L1-like esterase